MIRRAAGLCLVLASCSSSSSSSSLAISDGWSRPTPPITNVAAFYFVIENATGEDASLVAASSEACAQMEVHESVLEDAIMGMGAVEGVPVGAGQRVAFEPNGLHLMCLGLVEPVESGESYRVTAQFEGGTEITFTVVGDDR